MLYAYETLVVTLLLAEYSEKMILAPERKCYCRINVNKMVFEDNEQATLHKNDAKEKSTLGTDTDKITMVRVDLWFHPRCA